MTNVQYIENTLSTVDRILLDTSTLMCPGCQQFIRNNKKLICGSGKKLIIPKAVYAELARHLGGEDQEKSEHAVAAVELICTNKEIFEVENVPLTEEEIAHAFADAQLLSDLTAHRSEFNQLLISNDRNLSSDAFDLNQQQSCRGRKVLVCYINRLGEMHRCDCARPVVTESVAEDNEPETEIQTETQMEPEKTSAPAAAADQEWYFDTKSGVIGVVGAGVLYGICQALKYAINRH